MKQKRKLVSSDNTGLEAAYELHPKTDCLGNDLNHQGVPGNPVCWIRGDIAGPPAPSTTSASACASLCNIHASSDCTGFVYEQRSRGCCFLKTGQPSSLNLVAADNDKTDFYLRRPGAIPPEPPSGIGDSISVVLGALVVVTVAVLAVINYWWKRRRCASSLAGSPGGGVTTPLLDSIIISEPARTSAPSPRTPSPTPTRLGGPASTPLADSITPSEPTRFLAPALEAPTSTSARFEEKALVEEDVQAEVGPEPPAQQCIEIGTTDDWNYDVFISHAGNLKPLARELEKELHGLGFTAFVDATALNPGDQADEKMRDSAKKAPIGLVLFDENYVVRDWPMAELKLIVEAGTLLPVAIGLSHTELKAAWRKSQVAYMLDEAFLERVTRTTFIVDEGGWQGELRERICFATTRMFVEKVCPRLPNTGRSMRCKQRVLKAAKAIESLRLGTLRGRDIREAKKWVRQLENDIEA